MFLIGLRSRWPISWIQKYEVRNFLLATMAGALIPAERPHYVLIPIGMTLEAGFDGRIYVGEVLA